MFLILGPPVHWNFKLSIYTQDKNFPSKNYVFNSAQEDISI